MDETIDVFISGIYPINLIAEKLTFQNFKLLGSSIINGIFIRFRIDNIALINIANDNFLTDIGFLSPQYCRDYFIIDGLYIQNSYFGNFLKLI